MVLDGFFTVSDSRSAMVIMQSFFFNLIAIVAAARFVHQSDAKSSLRRHDPRDTQRQVCIRRIGDVR